jgi:hypothetical protein
MVCDLTYKRTLEKLVGRSIPDTIKPRTSWELIYTFARKYGIFHLLTTDSENCVRIGLIASYKHITNPGLLNQGFLRSVANGYIECVKEFIQSGKICPSARGALVLAIKHDREDMVSLLLDDSRVNLTELSHGERNDLINLASKHSSLIARLIDDPRISDEVRYQLFLKTVDNGYMHSVKVFLDAPIDLSLVKYQALRNAAKATCLSITARILDTIKLVDEDGKYQLLKIISELIGTGGDIRAIVLLLSKLPLTSQLIKSLLFESIKVSRTDIANVLIKSIDQTAVIDLTTIYAKAVETGQANIVAALIDTGRVSNFANISLKAAVARNFVRTVEMILDRVGKEDIIVGYRNILTKARFARNNLEMYNLLLNFQKHHRGT